MGLHICFETLSFASTAADRPELPGRTDTATAPSTDAARLRCRVRAGTAADIPTTGIPTIDTARRTIGTGRRMTDTAAEQQDRRRAAGAL